MARPLRLEFPGAVYHVTARGDRQEKIYDDEEDRRRFLDILGSVCGRFGWVVHAYCLMTNHYHIVVETPHGNLSRGMRQLNGVFTQSSNRRHRRVGHLFQGRYQAILVQQDAYMLELARYVVLNPVRAGTVNEAADWPWSSYRQMIGQENAPVWLKKDRLLAQFGRRRAEVVRAYRRFVQEGVGKSSPWGAVRHQVLLGDEGFVEKYKGLRGAEDLDEVPRAQRRAVVRSLTEYRDAHPDRNHAMARAYLSGAYTMKEVAEFFGVHYMTVSRAVRKLESDGLLECEN